VDGAALIHPNLPAPKKASAATMRQRVTRGTPLICRMNHAFVETSVRQDDSSASKGAGGRPIRRRIAPPRSAGRDAGLGRVHQQCGGRSPFDPGRWGRRRPRLLCPVRDNRRHPLARGLTHISSFRQSLPRHGMPRNGKIYETRTWMLTTIPGLWIPALHARMTAARRFACDHMPIEWLRPLA
jgi:hypothetical protein